MRGLWPASAMGIAAVLTMLLAASVSGQDDDTPVVVRDLVVVDDAGDVGGWPNQPECSLREGNLDVLGAWFDENASEPENLQIGLIVGNLTFESVNRCVWAVEWVQRNVSLVVFFSFIQDEGDFVFGQVDNGEFGIARGQPFTAFESLEGSFLVGEPGEIVWNLPKGLIEAGKGETLNRTHARTFFRTLGSEGWIPADRGPDAGYGIPYVIAYDPPEPPKTPKDGFRLPAPAGAVVVAAFVAARFMRHGP